MGGIARAAQKNGGGNVYEVPRRRCFAVIEFETVQMRESSAFKHLTYSVISLPRLLVRREECYH
jgi:hypothetical protein